MIELDRPLVVPMGEADLDEVCALAAESFTSPWDRGVFVEELTRDWAYLRVLRPSVRGPIEAFLSCWLVRDEVHVLNVATHPARRRRGHAETLLNHALGFARSRSARYASLEVRKTNRPAQTLYRKLGFETIGIRPRYYTDDGEDALVMLRAL